MKMKREPIYAKEGHIFQHKEREDEFAQILYLGEGVSLDDYKEITDEEYEEIMKQEEEELNGLYN
jgi:hypothetical protein